MATRPLRLRSAARVAVAPSLSRPSYMSDDFFVLFVVKDSEWDDRMN